MAYSFRGIPPRVLQRLLDNRSGRLPGRNRTGDRTRARWQTDAFDDVRTVVFDENQIVSFPQKLQTGSIHYDITLDPTQQFSSVTASVVAGVSDSLILQQTNVNILGPWLEDYIPEQGQTSSYWLTGTALEIGEGFTGQLRDKTVIRKILNVNTPYQMLSQTASMVYYNDETKTFDLAGAGTGFETSNPKPVNDVAFLNIAGIKDARLFGPFGNNIISGSNALGQFTSITDIAINKLAILQSIIGYSGTLLNKHFAANDNQVFTISEITEPFLLEKIEINIPFAIGHDWFQDKTRVLYGTGEYQWDCGGPAITVAIQRQDSENRRELICSATIIPENDAVYTKEYARLAFDAGFSQSLPTDPEPNEPWTFPAGFLCFGTPSRIIFPNNNTQFTGTISVNPDISVSNGIVSMAVRSGLIGGLEGPEFNKSLVLGINPFGRGMDLRPSGRSYFGKEYTSIDREVVIASPVYETNISPVPLFKIYNAEQSSHSPYVILPNDKLILSVSKYRSILNQYATSSFGDYTAADQEAAILSGSHDVVLNSGQIELIMYGSLLSERKQYHHGLNQQLTSLAIHESIGQKTVFDQFDVESPIVFSGSYIDDIITGTLGYDENGVLKNDRGVVASITGAQYLVASKGTGYSNLPDNVTSSGSLLRAVTLQTDAELYYDSLVPNIYETQIRDDGDVWAYEGTVLPTQGVQSIGKLNFVHLGPHLPRGGTNDVWEDITGSDWNQSFPFQSKYANLSRYRYDKFSGQNTHAIDIRSGFYDPSGRFGYIQTAKRYSLSRMMQYDASPSATEFIYDTLAVLANDISIFPTGVLETNSNVIARATYGFGNDKQIIYDPDGNHFYTKNNSPRWIQPDPLNQNPEVIVSPPADAPFPTYPYIGYVSGSNSLPVIVHVYRNVEIEGWKYGLKSAFPTSPKMIMSYRHYGYLRDVLEQRQFSKYVIDGKIEDGPVRVKFTLPDPSSTDSSNLHYEATSSLPYFDGEARNRGAFTGYELVQVEIP